MKPKSSIIKKATTKPKKFIQRHPNFEIGHFPQELPPGSFYATKQSFSTKYAIYKKAVVCQLNIDHMKALDPKSNSRWFAKIIATDFTTDKRYPHVTRADVMTVEIQNKELILVLGQVTSDIPSAVEYQRSEFLGLYNNQLIALPYTKRLSFDLVVVPC